MDMAALLHHGGSAAETGRWGSLGLWPAADYASACAALARLHGQAAGLRPGARVLAPGCGAGAELRLWRDAFGAAELTGIDPQAPSTPSAPSTPPTPPATATPRPPAAADSIRVLRGTAAQMDRLAGSGFDAVIANDSAYHFGTHADWLQAAARSLRPGGRIAFTDLVLEPRNVAGRLAAPLLPRLLRLQPIAISALQSVQRVRQALLASGFADVQVQSLDDAVLGGFVDFARAQRRRLGALADTPAWRPVALTAAALPTLRALGLGYALFAATRR